MTHMNDLPIPAASQPKEPRRIRYGDFVLPVSAPAHFAFLLLVIDPHDAGDIPRAGYFHVQRAFPEYALPPEIEYMSEAERDQTMALLRGIYLTPISSLIHHEDTGLVLVTQAAKQFIADYDDDDSGLSDVAPSETEAHRTAERHEQGSQQLFPMGNSLPLPLEHVIPVPKPRTDDARSVESDRIPSNDTDLS